MECGISPSIAAVDSGRQKVTTTMRQEHELGKMCSRTCVAEPATRHKVTVLLDKRMSRQSHRIRKWNCALCAPKIFGKIFESCVSRGSSRKWSKCKRLAMSVAYRTLDEFASPRVLAAIGRMSRGMAQATARLSRPPLRLITMRLASLSLIRLTVAAFKREHHSSSNGSTVRVGFRIAEVCLCVSGNL